MAATNVLLDTGPLVAFLARDDQHHSWAVDAWSALHDPLLTCESVLSEAVFILNSEGIGPEPLAQLLSRGIIRVPFIFNTNQSDLLHLLRKYADQPISLADACLVRMAEEFENSRVFTTDRDFLIYKRNGRHLIPLLAPFAR